jgi:glutathione peroxidase
MDKSGDVFSSVPNSFWDLTAEDIDGTEVKFDSYKGAKAFLIVNVASACGYTPNYSYLGKFYDTYK